MEIQWVMLAKEIRTNPDTTMCIDGIFHRIDLDKVVSKPSMMLIAKLNPSPTDIGKTKRLLLRVEHDGELVGGLTTQYRVHDEDTWGNRFPYITMRLAKVGLPYLGKYTFKILVDGEFQNEESITVE